MEEAPLEYTGTHEIIANADSEKTRQGRKTLPTIYSPPLPFLSIFLFLFFSSPLSEMHLPTATFTHFFPSTHYSSSFSEVGGGEGFKGGAFQSVYGQ